MLITDDQLNFYRKEGFLLIENCFSTDEVALLKKELPALFREESLRRVVEKNGDVVRSVYGSHTTSRVFYALAHHPRLVEPALQILGGPAYIHQFKLNAKAAFGGDLWEWHQDYVFWQKEDGILHPRLVNVVVFLDEVNEFNGPLFLIPGSQNEGVIDVPARDADSSRQDGTPDAYAQSPDWISNLTADLKYSLNKDTIGAMVKRYGLVAPKGPAGSVLFFHCNIAHGSNANMSPFDRNIAIVTYNSVENTPTPVANPRPDFLVSRDYTPVVSQEDDVLLRLSSSLTL